MVVAAVLVTRSPDSCGTSVVPSRLLDLLCSISSFLG